MRAYVIGNVTIDETIIVDALPTSGASILGEVGAHDLGGKGTNQAIVMARCGVATTLVTPVGNDARATAIRQRLQNEPLVAELVELQGKASDVSIIFRLPDGENAIVTTTESARNLSASDVAPLLQGAQPGDLAILQGNLSHQATREILEQARCLQMITAFNPSPLRPYFSGLWDLVDVVFLNQGEALALTGTTGNAAAAYLLECGLRDVVLTLGHNGAILANAEEMIAVPAHPSVVVDTTGAGDTFMSVALASSARRTCRLDRLAIEHAVKAAAVTVSRKGTQSAFPTSHELETLLASH
ncbi:ribokinase [Phyllobacterium myrsinacearum]|uniref:Ribokinase n=1 Tax=Phyllobacterium myrsinacearum TaxID=28101 RepID=A0A839EIG1_9HYPH|nr:ribokinase [Phyllobacterium myrsinacearum]MBA8880113.1 ribokinase [Phyllobacterium myrsinacearum]